MSEVMTQGIIGMPYEMAMSDELSRRQFHGRAQGLLADYAALAAECERLRQDYKEAAADAMALKAELESIKAQPAIGETCRGHQAGVIFYTHLPYPPDKTKLYAKPTA